MSTAAKLPIVAIVGRPNVGKSTLFNRYAGRRRALVADRPGITRDRIAEEIEVAGRPVLLVDTAGLDPDAEAGLPAAIQAQARAAVADADAILFLVDGKSGLLPEDAALARTLHRAAKPLLLAVNKVDLPQHEARIAEFHGLGFDPVRAVSAEHGRGAWDALEELVAELPEAPAPEPAGEGVCMALVGRPNVFNAESESLAGPWGQSSFDFNGNSAVLRCLEDEIYLGLGTRTVVTDIPRARDRQAQTLDNVALP